MKMITEDEFSAGVLAPLVAGPIMFLIVFFSAGSSVGNVIEFIGSALIITTLSIIVSYIAVVVIGLPIILVLKKLKIYNFISVSLSGFIVMLLYGFDLARGIRFDEVTLMFSLCGFSVSTAYSMMLWRPHITNKSR